MNEFQQPDPDSTLAAQEASLLVDNACKGLDADPLNIELIRRNLYDLKIAIVHHCVAEKHLPIDSELEWELAQNLADFDVAAFYQKRTTFLALGVSVILGWILGGLFSAFLNIFSMGGDILRVLSIFAILCLNEYLASSNKARKRFLAILGLGGLAKFATVISSGFLRLTSLGAWRTAIFGVGRLPNIFKLVWLIFGSFFIFALFSKKITSLDLSALKESLTSQVKQDMTLINFFLDQLQKQKEELNNFAQNNNSYCADQNCDLAQAVISLLPSLNADQSSYLAQKLEEAGFSVPIASEDVLTWDEAKDSELFETIGLINDGDHYKVLKMPVKKGSKIIKGHAQRISS